jgi:hypothetical protein
VYVHTCVVGWECVTSVIVPLYTVLILVISLFGQNTSEFLCVKFDTLISCPSTCVYFLIITISVTAPFFIFTSLLQITHPQSLHVLCSSTSSHFHVLFSLFFSCVQNISRTVPIDGWLTSIWEK